MKTILCLLSLGAIIGWSGCRKSGIGASATALSVSSSTNPGAVHSQGQSVTIDFGNVPIGEIATLEIDLVSLSGTSVTVASVQMVQANAAFAFPLSAGVTVQPSPPAVVQASFTPARAGPQSASYQITLDSGSSVIVTFTGNGFPVSLSVSPDPVDFGSVEIQTSQSKQVIVTNSSSQPITLGLIPPAGGPFTIGSLSNNQLAAGASLTLAVSYSPLQVETDTSSFSLTGCVGCSDAGVVVPLQGAGVASILSFPNPLKFGFVLPQTSVQQTLALKNIGNIDLQISSQPILYPGSFVPPNGQPPVYAFSVGSPNVNYPYTLNPGGELDLPITFTPPQIGAFLDATVTFQSNDPALPSPTVVKLQGYGGGAHISCLPSSLDLGPTAIGYSSSESLICFNAGTDVPNHPEAALQLSQSLLVTTNPDFAATLQDTLDGGLSLSAGQSATVQVVFTPRGSAEAGPETGMLQVGSNDIAHDPVSVPLAGLGVIPGSCNASLLPAGGLSFGEVPKGGSATLQFAVQNQGNNYCIVKDVALAAGSDPAFSFPSGPIAYQLLSFPGDPNNTNDLPTEFRVPVQFSPTQTKATATGTVDLQIANANPVNWAVPLTGSSAAGCLTVNPSEANFGLVGFNAASQKLCFAPQQNVTLQNSCGNPVTLESLTLLPNLDGLPQFVLSGLPSVPQTIAPGGQVLFTVTFAASQAGPKVETIQVATDEFSTPYSLSLNGDAESTGSRTDSFVVPSKQLDFVLILDVDDDSATGLKQFVPQIPSLITEANSAQLDYRIAVVTDATCSQGDQSWFLPCDHCMVNIAPNDAVFITPQSTPSPATVLTRLVTDAWNGTYSCGKYSDEQFFEVPFQTFGSALLAGHNAGFLRDSAFLGMLTINTDSEDDNTTLSAANTKNYLQMLKPNNPSLVSWSYINQGLGNDPTAKVSTLAAGTGGILIDMSVNGWEVQLVNLFSSIIDLGVFRLSAQPVTNSVMVTVNGSLLPQTSPTGYVNWRYDSTHNAIVLSSGAIPPIGSPVTVTYSIGCS